MKKRGLIRLINTAASPDKKPFYPPLEGIEKICAVIGISISEFFCSEDCPYRSQPDIQPALVELAQAIMTLDTDTQLRLIDAWERQLDLIVDGRKR